MASSEPNAKALLSAAASFAASAMLIRSIANDFLPHEVHGFFSSFLHGISRKIFSSQLTIVVEEFQGFSPNEVFDAASAYLGTKAPTFAQRVKISKNEDQNLTVSMDRDEEVIDEYDNIQVKWRFVCSQVESASRRNSNDLNACLRSEIRSYELSFHKKNKEKVLSSYIPYVLKRAKSIKEKSKVTKLHTVAPFGAWDEDPIALDHPMTFKTLAMDSEIKKALLEDLSAFMNGKEYYRKIGKAWKRGYLLYGPPGTGKSSLIAAMANYLNYDIYDLELTEVRGNSELRSLLLRMSSKSILVIEDIDCTIKLQNRESDDESFQNGENQVTLSGLLNFIDGLWSCCGEERIIVFTTNHKERLDPALLRPGRMDMHINLSYCTFSAFKQLAFNYLGIDHHKLFEEIERLLCQVEATPAEVAGELMKRNDAEVCLKGLIQFLHSKIPDQEVKQDDDDQNE
ncbi:hypothetical protein SLA2020_129220 [Shorea laevis]